jgi:hypothetical protein
MSDDLALLGIRWTNSSEPPSIIETILTYKSSTSCYLYILLWVWNRGTTHHISKSEQAAMANQKVLLLGATGETGGDILNGLIEDGSFVSIVMQF